VHGLPTRKPGGEESLIPGALHNGPAVAGELFGEFLPVAGADDVAGGIMRQPPSDECYCRTMGFEPAGSDIDDQPIDVALPASLKLRGHQLDVWSGDERRLRI